MASAKPAPTPTPSWPKIELRSRTGAPYARAGHRWTPEWQELPVEMQKDEAKAKLLQDDPHIDVRVNGKRQPKFQGDVVEETAAPTTDAAAGADGAKMSALQKELSEAHERHASAVEDHAEEVSRLKARITELENVGDRSTTPTLHDAPSLPAAQQPADVSRGPKRHG
jgi:hypothetical protein